MTNEASIRGVPDEDIVQLKPRGGESYHNMWQKTREAFKFLTKAPWIDEYTWFFFGGDDAFLIPENLRKFVSEPEMQALEAAGAPIYVGYRQTTRVYKNLANGEKIPIDYGADFVSGAGYVMNGVTLHIAGMLIRESPMCTPNLHASHEDVFMAECLKSVGIQSRDGRDAHGEDRFIVLSPLHMQFQAANADYSWWWRDYRDRQMPSGLDIVSRDTVLFHYIDQAYVKRMALAIYGTQLGDDGS